MHNKSVCLKFNRIDDNPRIITKSTVKHAQNTKATHNLNALNVKNKISNTPL